MVGVRKGWVVTGIAIVLLAGYVLVLKPYFFGQGLSEQDKALTNDKLDAIIAEAQQNTETSPEENVTTQVEDTSVTEDVDQDSDALESVKEIQGSTDAEIITDSSSNEESNDTVKSNQSETVSTASKVEAIKKRYVKGLEEIKLTAESLINDLISEAKFEYQNLSDEDKKDVLVAGKLASKYMSRANDLESIIDDSVEALLSSYEAELTSNALPTDSVDELRSKYELEKKERREALLSKALNYQP